MQIPYKRRSWFPSMLLHCLPDELWITILNEWIGTTKILCAFDEAVCNVLQRERYLTWLRLFSAWSTMHFETVKSANNPRRYVSNMFFDWCKKRKIYPKSLSLLFDSKMFFHSPDCADEREILKNVETVKCFDRYNTTLYPITIFLDRFPKIKCLELICSMITNSTMLLTAPERFLQYDTHALQELKLHRTIFSFSRKEFNLLIQRCPHLRSVLLHSCVGIHYHHLVDLVCNATQLATLDCFFSSEIDCRGILWGDNDGGSIVHNVTMKKLSLAFCYSISEKVTICHLVAAIFHQCIELEDISLSCVNFDLFDEQYLLSDLICNQWKHLQVLRLRSIEPINEILTYVSLACTQLKHLHILSCKSLSVASIQGIFEHFPQLLTLEFQNCIFDDFPFLVERMQRVLFRSSLQTFILKDCCFSLPPHDYWIQDMLALFPALQAVELKVSNYTQILTPFPAMPHIIRLAVKNAQGRTYTMPTRHEAQLQKIQPANENTTTTATAATVAVQSDYSPPVGYVLLDFSRYSSLQVLSLSSCHLYPIELSLILTLPTLEELKLLFIVSDILFDPDTYPSCNLAPLKILDVYFILGVHFTEMKLLVLLSRFPTLKELLLSKIDILRTMDETTWKKLRASYRYRVNLIAS